jgi:hypothetical protein
MYLANVRRISLCFALIAGLRQTVLAAEILIADAKSQPESESDRLPLTSVLSLRSGY